MTSAGTAGKRSPVSLSRTAHMELRAADVYCRYLANAHYENFAVASRILPASLRLHLARIYAYCRTTDDLGDESNGDALARLARWREQVEECLAGSIEPVHPVLLALRQTVVHYDLPRRPFLDLIQANIQDQQVTSYATWDDLLAYCALSAAPVGRMVLGVFGVREPRAERLSDDVCVALQLANFAQDVRVDAAKGRTYLPQDDLRELGTRGAVKAMCQQAARRFASGEQLEQLVPARLRIQLSLYRLGGLAILSAIERQGYRTDEHRPTLTTYEKLRVLADALALNARSSGRARAAHSHHPQHHEERPENAE